MCRPTPRSSPSPMSSAVMNSELRRALMPSIDPESRKGRQMMNDFAGVDVEKQVNRVVAYVEPYTPPGPTGTGKTGDAQGTGAGPGHVRARAHRSVHSRARGDHGRVQGAEDFRASAKTATTGAVGLVGVGSDCDGTGRPRPPRHRHVAGRFGARRKEHHRRTPR